MKVFKHVAILSRIVWGGINILDLRANITVFLITCHAIMAKERQHLGQIFSLSYQSINLKKN